MAVQAIPYPSEQRPSKEKELLTMILDNAHIYDCAVHGKSVMTVLLTRRQIDLLGRYGAEDEKLDDGNDAEYEEVA